MTKENIPFTQEEVTLLKRAHACFKTFVTEILGIRKNSKYMYKDLCKVQLESVELLQNKQKNSVMFLEPRHSFKSAVKNTGYILWRLMRNPNLRILIYSDTATKASGFLQDIKNHIEGRAPGSLFRKLVGQWETVSGSKGEYGEGKWNEGQIVISAREVAFREPSVDTSGIEATKVGMHYDIIVFDDIVSDLNVTTKAQMDKVHECYKKALSLLKPGGEVVMLGTRWHYGDTYGRILAENKDKQNFETFIQDAEKLDENGKLQYESIGLDRSFLDYQKGEQGSYLYSCLYRNNPVSDDTALFKIENFNYYEPHKEFHKDLYITGTCDPAGEGEDFTAITVVGTDKNRTMFVLDAVCKHLKPNQIVDEVIKLNYKWGFDRFTCERNYFRGTLERDFKQAEREHLQNSNYKQFAFREDTISSNKQRNFNRVLALQPMHERGMIHLPGKNFNTLRRVYSELAFQMIQFTIDGSKSPHDDLLISLAMHLDIAQKGGEAKAEEPHWTSAVAIENAWFNEELKRRRCIPRKYRQQLVKAFS